MPRVAVIGLGRIGSAFDAVPGPAPRTHVGAVRVTPGLTLAAAVDPSPAARTAAARQWGWGDEVRLASAIEDLPPGCAEVVTLCTPGAVRLAAVRAALALRPRILLIEKPLAPTLDEAEQIVRLAEDAGVELRVNFHRRFDPGIRAAHVALGEGVPRMVVMRYGKGLYNYASHHVDLLLDWFGRIDSVQAIGAEVAATDPTLSFRCRMQAGFDAVVLGLDGLDYDQFEIDVFMPDRRLDLVAGGVEKHLYRPVPDRYYAGYSHLGEPVAAAPAGPVSGFGELYAAIAAHLREGTPLAGCSGAEALTGLRVLDAARRSAELGGVVVELEHRE